MPFSTLTCRRFVALATAFLTIIPSNILTAALPAAVPQADVEADPEFSILIERQNAQPVMGGQNFPDPCVIRLDNGWTAFSTNARIDNKLVHVQVAQSPDYQSWQFLRGHDALPNLPSWVDSNNPRVWAPDVVQVNDGSFVLYFAAATKQDTGKHCIGVATSANVQGPYRPTSNSPWICPLSQGGAIDVSGFIDGNQRYVTYKVDGNAIGHGGECGNTVAPIRPTPIMLQRVSGNGRDLIGGPTQILANIPSDGPYVEAPHLNKMSGKYVLFFSSNCFTGSKYDVEYATADKISGPYTRRGQIFKTGSRGMVAPGGLDIAVDGNKVVWHGNFGSGRAMYVGSFALQGTAMRTS